MNKKLLSNIRNQPDSVLYVIFRSIKTIVCIFPNNITLIRKQIHKQTSKKYYPEKLEDEFMEYSIWIDSSWTRVKVSYNDIAFIVVYELPILSTIHTVEEWKKSRDMIMEQITDFADKIREITIQ